MKTLPLLFYERSALIVAPDLLGCILVRTYRRKIVTGRIVEVEAYRQDDPASHSFVGPTDRNRTMFGPAGCMYVYFIYGMHFCANVVTGSEGVGEAVLIRAVEPLTGLETMSWRRYGRRTFTSKTELRDLARGPGRLCKAFRIGQADDGCRLDSERLFIARPEGTAAFRIVRTARIGIRHGTEKRWRFTIAGNQWVSGLRPR